MDVFDFLGFLVIVLGIVAFAALIWGVILVMKEALSGRCPNCGRSARKTNLFCPWCHRDLRGGGKD